MQRGFPMKKLIFTSLLLLGASVIPAAAQSTCSIDLFTTAQLLAELQRRQQQTAPVIPAIPAVPVRQPKVTRLNVPVNSYISFQVDSGLLTGRFDVEGGVGVEMYVFDSREFRKFQKGEFAKYLEYSGYNMNWQTFNVSLDYDRNYVVFKNDSKWVSKRVNYTVTSY